MNRKKVVSMLLASALAVSSFGGFVSASEEPMEIQLFKTDISKVTEDQPMRKWLEERHNIKLVPGQRPTEKDAVSLQIASGEIPEILWDVSFADYRNYVDQGVIAEIPIEWIQEYAPDLYAWAIRDLGENVFEYTSIDGKNYSLPTGWTLANDGLVLGWRQDILEAAGVEKVPETLEEMETVLKAVKDANGFAPYTGAGLGSLSAIYGAYGTYQTYYEKDGKIVYGPVEDSAKEAVTLLNKWYEEGLLDPEFMINKFDNVKEKWANDQALTTEFYWWEFLPQEAFFSGSLYECKEDDPNFKNVVADPPKGPNGDMGITQGNPISNAGLCFGKQLEDQPEKIKKYLQVYNDSMVREAMDHINYGVEGETYNWNEETGVEWIAPYDDPAKRDEYGIGYAYMIGECFNDYALQAKYTTQPQYMDLRNDAQSHGIGKGSPIEPMYRPIYDEKSEILDKIYTNAHIDFITGERDLAEWDAFVEEWMSAGGEEVLAEAQAAYEAMTAK